MTAALVIVPVHAARARVAGGIHAVSGELPWMVRLSTGDGAASGTGQQSLATGPWVDPTGDAATSPRRPLLASVPAYRSASHLF
jgi:hypothetical protein